MKEIITRACGHVETVEVFGTAAERERRINYLESTECDACTATKTHADCEQVEMHYGEYKKNYSDCDTLPNSYNKETKTIIVFVKKEEPEVTDETAEPEEITQAIAELEEIPETIEEIAEIAGANPNGVRKIVECPNSEIYRQFAKANERTRKALTLILAYKNKNGLH